MLLRLLGLIFLSVLCSSDEDITDDTQVFNELTQQFEGPPPDWNARVQRSAPFANYSDMPVNNPMMGPDPSVMFPDTSICDVILSTPENVSIDQVPFFCICSHCKASTGLKGERGDRGPPGYQGSSGRKGRMGFRGPRGFTGPPGVKGQKGELGDKGQPGRVGFPGVKGALGVKGAKGDHGDEGPAGQLGLQGVPGSCLCEPVVGLQGRQGPPGPAGARGLPGTTGSKGMAGAKGDKGDMGIAGRDGAEGLKGEQGDPGPCDCADGVDGADGLKGEKGEIGDKGDIGLKGDQGEPGTPGEQGVPGLPGMPGPCSLAPQSAFSVALETPFPEMGRPVRFRRIIYNVQGHYYPTLGVYIIPVNGTYVCNFHLGVKDKILIAGLYVNFFPVLVVTEATNMATVSQSVTLRFKQRDMVWVQVKDLNSNGMYTDPEISSTFSCFLIRPDACDLGGFRDHKPMNLETIEAQLNNSTWRDNVDRYNGK